MSELCQPYHTDIYPTNFVNLETPKPQIKTFSCQFNCGKVFSSNADLLRHERIHSDSFKLKCKLCDYKSAQTSNLKRHYNSKHRGFQDENFIYNFKTVEFTDALQTQITTCFFCKERFSCKSSLKKHLKLKHSFYLGYTCLCGNFYQKYEKFIACCQKSNYFDTIPVENTFISNKINKDFTCRLCGSNFKTNFTLKRHIDNQHGHDAKVFNCPFSVTQKTIKDAIENERHPFRVQLSKDLLEAISVRYNDIVSAGNDVLFSKNLECTKTFKRLDHLENHLLSVHQVDFPEESRKKSSRVPKTFTCRFCSKIFVRKMHLTKHEKTHTGFWQHWCNVCSRGFSSIQSKSAHKCTNEIFDLNSDFFYF